MNSEPSISTIAHPPLQAFLDQGLEEITVAQVLVKWDGVSWRLRHLEDRDAPDDSLRTVSCQELRTVAQFTSAGAFRPLKSAPNLPAGWRACAASKEELASALDQLYPGFLSDWYAQRNNPKSATDFRTYVDRQSGMYRIVALLSDVQATRVVQSCCPARFCLKRRCWTVCGLSPDAPASKSIIPCLEPCAVFMEFARIAMRMEQAAPVSVGLAPAELETAITALQEIGATDFRLLRADHTDHTDGNVGEADFASPLNPRRVQWTLEKLRSMRQRQKDEHESE